MNKNYFLILLSTAFINFSLFSFSAAAEDVSANEEEKVKPDDDKDNPLENVDINIIKRDGKTIETHSVRGIVYKVKITPSSGPAYYLYDTDGNGSLETRSNREISETTVQQWKIFQW
ncbi:MAG: DUF2782 domain-containing protein [gamma proteobacterium symbiont of Taylorina sp.]|nr:DUF2782 domain-containing protein [gamma proteobacterium symbiont of Taylorina sp.]